MGMEIYFTDRNAAANAPGAARPPSGALRAFAALDVPQDMPFFLDADGRYPRLLNQFLRDLPTMGCGSPETWRAYAMDVQGLLLHLDEVGCPRDLLDLEFDDLRAYRDRRRNGEPPEVSATTWNRCLAALTKLFDWLVDEGHRERTPFRFRKGWSRHGGAARINSMHERAPADDGIKCVSLRHYELFRSVGLSGALPDGRTPDPGFRGRNVSRNLAIADLLLSTGMRVTEGVSIMGAELPATSGGVAGRGAHRFRVASEIAKRRKARDVLIPSRPLSALARYADEDRAHAVALATQRGAYEVGRDWRPMRHVAGRKARLLDVADGRPRSYDVLGAKLRAALVVVDDLGRPLEPAALFLAEDGRPLTADDVRVTFSRASDRCTELLGEDFDVTPHTLRHTYAVHMLAILLHQHLRVSDTAALRVKRDAIGMDGLRELATNPLRILMTLLGHKSVETTYRYLTHVVEVGEVADAAAVRFDAELAAAGGLVRGAMGPTARATAGDRP